ncbi:Trans-aconitate 2-methyltransferase [invertebrate metagenome]|uniref:Trans-aconitate 2-methyltransferase n=1 Tax=invertebrate metagenome TaxID=1711999 RepID=A0A484H892_9ZZZZ
MALDRSFQHKGSNSPELQTSAAFSRLAPYYEHMAILERASGERLLDMLAIGPRDFVLDLGCGSGDLTRRIRTRTNGKLVGVDASAGMVAQARWHAQGSGIIFLSKMAENLDFDRNFNVIFCNSALQWFSSPGRVVDGCHRALRRGGWLGAQAPATRQWCSLVRDIMIAAATDSRTRDDFGSFRDPMFFMATVGEYVALLNGTGFDVHDAWIELETTRHTPTEALNLLRSMAGAALFNVACYERDVGDTFLANLNAVVRDTILAGIGEDGMIEVNVHRLYILAIKPLLA